MSNKARATGMKQVDKSILNPKLRFPEFRNAPGWKKTLLKDVLIEHGLKSDGGSEVHSVSVHKGVINQKEHLGRSFAAADTSNYNLARPYDIIYTKSPTGNFPFGVVKQNKLSHNAIVSPLYGVFEPINRYLGYILDAYFESSIRTSNYLAPITQKGAKNTIQITNDTFLSKGIYIPLHEEEQQKIADCLTSLDELISAQAQKVDALRVHKKGLMQLLFPREGETQPRLRFPEFQNAGKWEETRLEQLGKLISGLTYSPDDVRNKGLLVLRSSNIRNERISLDDCVYVDSDIQGANLLAPNDILICVRNGSTALIGKNALIPEEMPLCTPGAFMTAFRSKSAKFVFQLFQTENYQKQVASGLGATINSINGSQLVKYKFVVPKPEEQQKIAALLSFIDDLVAAQTKKLEALKTHKKGLMQLLFPSPEVGEA